jgi:hypothetical protein
MMVDACVPGPATAGHTMLPLKAELIAQEV